MLSSRLITSVGAALLLTACAGVDGTERGAIRENVIEPGITAIGEARSESCGINASTLRTAIEAYTLFENEPPPNEQALVDEGFLRSPIDDWDVVDGVIVPENPACGTVPPTVPAEQIVTDSGVGEALSTEAVLDTFTDAEIELFGGEACAREVAMITSGANRYFTDQGVEPEAIADLERAGYLDEPVTMWQVIDDELRPTTGSPCPDFIGQG